MSLPGENTGRRQRDFDQKGGVPQVGSVLNASQFLQLKGHILFWAILRGPHARGGWSQMEMWARDVNVPLVQEASFLVHLLASLPLHPPSVIRAQGHIPAGQKYLGLARGHMWPAESQRAD